MTRWKEITSIEEWKEAMERSVNQSVVILKHSTACPVSFNALKEYEQYLAKDPNIEAEYLLVKVIESRPVSNQIAEDLGVQHASPQMIYVKHKDNYWNASHYAITEEHLTAVLN